MEPEIRTVGVLRRMGVLGAVASGGEGFMRTLGGLQVSTIEVEKMRGWRLQGVSVSGVREEPELALREAGMC